MAQRGVRVTTPVAGVMAIEAMLSAPRASIPAKSVRVARTLKRCGLNFIWFFLKNPEDSPWGESRYKDKPGRGGRRRADESRMRLRRRTEIGPGGCRLRAEARATSRGG